MVQVKMTLFSYVHRHFFYLMEFVSNLLSVAGLTSGAVIGLLLTIFFYVRHQQQQQASK